ncbi:MAG: hypothetical protein IT291_00340 [Deltaproteobacteria bacterium]|nr:hypothetical protein [Deltaproteobacteria bacterium]
MNKHNAQTKRKITDSSWEQSRIDNLIQFATSTPDEKLLWLENMRALLIAAHAATPKRK